MSLPFVIEMVILEKARVLGVPNSHPRIFSIAE